MTASISSRRKYLQAMAGDQGVAKVQAGRYGLVYRVTCVDCEPGGHKTGRWTTYRNGNTDNSYNQALDRWILHLAKHHPDTDAPCMQFLERARQRYVAPGARQRQEIQRIIDELTASNPNAFGDPLGPPPSADVEV